MLKDVNCEALITQLICVIEIVQSNKELRMLKAGSNLTTPKQHRFWSSFDSGFFIWHLQRSFMNVIDLHPQGYEL